MDIEDEEVEEEFRRLEQEMANVDLEDETSESRISLCPPSLKLGNDLTNLNLHENPPSEEPSINNRIPEIA